MKTNRTLRNFTLFLTLLALLFSTQVFAQPPANDDCANAFPVTIGVDEASCIPVAGSTVGGTASTTPESVCSGSWYQDDIWFSFTTDAVVPEDGYTIKAYYGTETGDLGQAGMALYNGCNADAIPLVCFSDAPGRVTIEPYSCEYLPNHTYYVRIWSAPDINTNSGALRLCVFNAPPPPPPPVDPDIILWGDMPGEGDFEGGLNGWTTFNDGVACSDTFDLWRWVPIAASTGNSCGNSTSSAPSYCNGGMAFNSDGYDSGTGPCGGGGGECPASQNGELISPAIDVSSFGLQPGEGISLKFFQTTRQFNSVYFIMYSNDDGATWIEKQINTELVQNDNPTDEFKKVFLKFADLNATNFRVKFRYEANFYYWVVDDVQIIKTEAHNLQCAPNNFYAIAPNLVTPVSQVEPFSHLADIYNAGAVEQTNVNLHVSIVDDATSNEVFTDDLPYDPIPGDSLVENLPMPGYFTPDGTTPTSYTATYTISADSMDAFPNDNVQTYSFMTSDTVFAKEQGATGSFNPAATNWEGANEAHSAAYGNYFYVVDGDNWYASSVSFMIGNGEDPQMVGRLLSVYLYSWDDDTNEDGDMDTNERTRVGFAIYEIQGTETEDDMITLSLNHYPNNEPGPVDIESNQAYAVMVEYVTIDQVDFIMRNSTALDYGAMVTRSELDGIPDGNGRYSPLVGLNDDLESEPYGSVGFGRNTVPVVRLNIAPPPDAVDNPLDVANSIKISPNPSNNTINLAVDLVEVQERVSIRIHDINGRLLLDQAFENLQHETLQFDVSKYASGAYFLHFVTNDGVRTERFIVHH